MSLFIKSSKYTRFFWGLGLFIFSAGTLLLVRDPYIMADFALILLSIYLMVSGVTHARKLDN